jgi:SAM-dependent methyltransferase
MAESFGVDAERYDRARPAYPGEVVDRIVSGSSGPDVLDVGCGTGIASRQFRDAGCQVLGVEPDARMAEFARRTGLDVEVATFEDWDPAGRLFDAVIAAMSWHWVDPAVGAAKAARILRPGGRLAAFGHAFEPAAEVAKAFAEVFQRVVPDSPFDFRSTRSAVSVYEAGYAKIADGIRAAGGFGDPEQWSFETERSYARDEWLDLLSTQGGLTRLPPDKLAEVLGSVGAAIDDLGGSFTLRYTTVAVSAVRA